MATRSLFYFRACNNLLNSTKHKVQLSALIDLFIPQSVRHIEPEISMQTVIAGARQTPIKQSALQTGTKQPRLPVS